MNVRKMVDNFFKYNPRSRMYELKGIRGAITPYSLYFNQGVSNNANPFVVNTSTAKTNPASYKNPYSANNGLDQGFGNPFLCRNFTFSDSGGELRCLCSFKGSQYG
jgi:hypothetical protein